MKILVKTTIFFSLDYHDKSFRKGHGRELEVRHQGALRRWDEGARAGG